MFCDHCGYKIEKVEGKNYLECWGCGCKYDFNYDEIEQDEDD